MKDAASRKIYSKEDHLGLDRLDLDLDHLDRQSLYRLHETSTQKLGRLMDKSTLESGGLRVECPHIDTDSLSKVGGSEEDAKRRPVMELRDLPSGVEKVVLTGGNAENFSHQSTVHCRCWTFI